MTTATLSKISATVDDLDKFTVASVKYGSRSLGKFSIPLKFSKKRKTGGRQWGKGKSMAYKKCIKAYLEGKKLATCAGVKPKSSSSPAKTIRAKSVSMAKSKSASKSATHLKSPHAKLTVEQLKKKAKQRGLKGYSKMKKAELRKLLNIPQSPAYCQDHTVRKLKKKPEYKALGKGRSKLRKNELCHDMKVRVFDWRNL